MKIITLKSNGTFEHLWLTSVHGDTIPDHAIQVTDADFMLLSQHPDSKKYDVEMGSVADYSAPFVFTNAFALKRTEITSGFKAAMSVITENYTAEDIASFPTQEAEAERWLADNAASTPFIDALLANRPSIDKASLVQRITNNAQSYKLVAGPIIGKKQAYEDQLYALQVQHNDPQLADVTQADFDAIEVSFS